MNAFTKILQQAKADGFTGTGDDFEAVENFIQRNYAGEVGTSDGRTLTRADRKALHDDWMAAKVRALEDELLGGGARKARTDTPDRQAARARGIDVGAGGYKSSARAEHVPGWLKSYREGKPLSTAGLSDCGFSSVTENILCAIDARRGNIKAAERLAEAGLAPLGALERKGMTENTGADGGFAVAPTFNAQIYRRAIELHPWLSRLTIYQTPTATYERPVLDDADRSGGAVGGVKLTRTGEAGTIASTQAVLKARNAHLHKAAGLLTLSNELRHDAPGMDTFVINLLADAVGLLMGEDVIRGIGSTAPLGILNGSDLYTVTAEAGQDADTIIGENVMNLITRQENKGNCVFLAHPNTLPQLMSASVQHKTSAGTAIASAHPLIQFSADEAFPMTLFGRPLHLTEHAALLGDKGDIICANLEAYWYWTSTSGIRIDTSEHIYFDSDQTAIRCVVRDDGGPYRDRTSRDRRNFETSNFVVIAARE